MNYWEEFYKKFDIQEPSLFAKWVAPQLPKGTKLVDVGCGNGRDSLYFRSLGHYVTSIDSSETGYEFLTIADCTDFWYRNQTIYCRWLLHSIDEVKQEKFLRRISNCGTNLFIECRSDKDRVPAVIGNHYRRPINRAKLEDQLKHFGFWINYSREQRGWSPDGEDNPMLIRIFATH